MSQPTKPLSVDEIFEALQEYKLVSEIRASAGKLELSPDQAKAHLVELVETLPELQPTYRPYEEYSGDEER